jgi:hypothetical protein
MFDYAWHRVFRRPYRLHVAHSGDTSKPVILLLHGIAASGEDWRKVLPHLEPDYHCITIDLLGFGKCLNVRECVDDYTKGAAGIRYLADIERGGDVKVGMASTLEFIEANGMALARAGAENSTGGTDSQNENIPITLHHSHLPPPAS